MTPSKSIIITLIGALSIYSLTKINFQDNFPFSILLFSSKETEKSIDSMCSNSELDLVDFYKTTGPNYNFNTPGGSDIFNELAQKLFTNSSSIEFGDITSFMFKSSLVIFLVLFIILIILWIPFICCICCKCCICIPKRILKCSSIFAYICFIFCVAILVLCFIGYFKNSSIFHGIYGFMCSLLKLGHHLLNGDDYKVKPYWSGVTPIIDILSNTTKNISNLFVLAKDMTGNLTVIDDLFKDMNNDLSYEYDFRVNNCTIYSPIPGEEKIFPSYLKNYGPPSNETTILGGIQKVLDDFEPYSAGPLREILDIIDLKDSAKDIKEAIEGFCDDLDGSIDDIDSKIGEVIDNFEDAIHEIDSVGRGVMNTLFSLNIGLMIAIFVSLLLMYYFKCGHCLLCISWFFLYIFMLLSLILGTLFLVLGLFVQGLSSGINYAIRSLDDDSDDSASDIINVCFNKDGILTESIIFPEDANISVIDAIYNLENDINGNINDLKMYNFSSISIIENQYEDFMKRPKYYIPQLVTSLNNIRKYIDLSSNDSYVSKESPSYDEWEITKDDCEEGYKYMPNDNNSKGIGSDKFCLVIEEWKLEDIKERYKNIKSNNESIDINDVIESYFNSISKCISSNDELISDIEKNNTKFNESIIRIKNKAIDALNSILGVVKPFRDSIREIVGAGSIFNILTCNFFKRDFNKILEELYVEFGSAFKSTSNIILSICALEFVMTLLMLIIIGDLIKKKKDKSREAEDNENSELMKGLTDIKEEEIVN